MSAQLTVKELETLVDVYLDWVRLERGLAANTVSAYQRDLSDFIVYCGQAQQNRRVMMIRGWLAHRESNGQCEVSSAWTCVSSRI